MPRTHWTTDEFWEMFQATHFLAEQLGDGDGEVELTKQAAIRYWLLFSPVGGSC
jgi:hypothetical protein